MHNPREYFQYRREIETRTKWLLEHNKYLEALFLYSAAVELELDTAIEFLERWTEHVLESKNIHFQMAEFREKQFPRGMSLGAKHNYLRTYLSRKRKRDLELDKWLADFISLRNEAAHDLSKKDLVKLEEKVRSAQITIEVALLTRLRSKRWDIERKLRRSVGQKRRRDNERRT